MQEYEKYKINDVLAKDSSAVLKEKQKLGTFFKKQPKLKKLLFSKIDEEAAVHSHRAIDLTSNLSRLKYLIKNYDTLDPSKTNEILINTQEINFHGHTGFGEPDQENSVRKIFDALGYGPVHKAENANKIKTQHEVAVDANILKTVATIGHATRDKVLMDDSVELLRLYSFDDKERRYKEEIGSTVLENTATMIVYNSKLLKSGNVSGEQAINQLHRLFDKYEKHYEGIKKLASKDVEDAKTVINNIYTYVKNDFSEKKFDTHIKEQIKTFMKTSYSSRKIMVEKQNKINGIKPKGGYQDDKK